MKNNILLVVVFILVGIFAFALGIGFSRRPLYFAGNEAPQFASHMAWMSRGRGARGGFHKGIIQGQISKIDGNNITLQLADAATYTVTIGDQTVIEKTTTGSQEDLKTGQNITVFPGQFLSGAQTILVNP